MPADEGVRNQSLEEVARDNPPDAADRISMNRRIPTWSVRRKGRIFTLQFRNDLLRQMEDEASPDEIGENEVGDPRLAHAGEVARSADPEVFLRDPEAVGRSSP